MERIPRMSQIDRLTYEDTGTYLITTAHSEYDVNMDNCTVTRRNVKANNDLGGFAIETKTFRAFNVKVGDSARFVYDDDAWSQSTPVVSIEKVDA